VSAKIKKRNPTSQVYNFKFDYDMGLSRRDTTNKTSIRLDYSNVKGYWDRIVDSPGIDDDGEKEARSLVKRFYSNSNKDWKKDYGTSNAFFEYESTNAIPIKQNISELVWYQTASDCEVDGEEYGEAFAAYVTGEMDAKMYIGFSMVAEYYGGELDVQQANGFVKAGGKSDLIYGIDGYSEVDFSRADKGNPIEGAKRSFNLKGSTISAGQNSFVSFNPYLEVTYELASLNGSDSTNFNNGATSFIGHLSTRVTQDFSNVTAFWPIDYPEDRKPDSGSFAPNDISVSKNNKVFYSDGDGGKLAVGTSVKFGVNVELEVHGRSRRTLESTAVGDVRPSLPVTMNRYFALHEITDLSQMALMYNTFSEFSFYPGVAGSDESCSDFTISYVMISSGRKSIVNFNFIIELLFSRKQTREFEMNRLRQLKNIL
jgi:chitinase